jgi:hypothetical protein
VSVAPPPPAIAQRCVCVRVCCCQSYTEGSACTVLSNHSHAHTRAIRRERTQGFGQTRRRTTGDTRAARAR